MFWGFLMSDGMKRCHGSSSFQVIMTYFSLSTTRNIRKVSFVRDRSQSVRQVFPEILVGRYPKRFMKALNQDRPSCFGDF